MHLYYDKEKNGQIQKMAFQLWNVLFTVKWKCYVNHFDVFLKSPLRKISKFIIYFYNLGKYLYQMLTRQNNKMVTLFFANKTKHNLEKGGGARAVQVIYETSNFF